MNTIPLGFEVGTGKLVEIPCRHMVVTGQTQEAGKTTTLEALISRSRLPAIAFITKRGEQSFSNARRIEPYFRERADWQFVASVLEATMRERLKFERAWIMRASKGAKSLADVQRNVRHQMLTAKGMSADVYLTLDAYLEIVVPRVASVKFAKSLDLKEGINALDLSDRDNFPTELQSLVMRSCLEWVYERLNGTITIIPEAWEFIPQGRGSPVKLAAVELIRKGAGLKNYVWLDSQDIGGVDKEMLRSAPLWLLGVQREANEISRTLSNIPAGVKKPKASEIATLQKGQFYACWGQHVIKTYVWPEWMAQEEARAISMGAEAHPVPAKKTIQPTETRVTETEAKQLREENQRLRDENRRLSEMKEIQPSEVMNCTIGNGKSEDLYQAILARLLKEPAIIELRRNSPEMNVTVARRTVQADDSSLNGMIAILLSEGFIEQTKGAVEVWREAKRRWNYGGISARCNEQLDKFTELGFVTKESDGYRAVPDMKVNIIKQ